MPFLYGEVNGNFLQTLCCILNMCISSLLVMRRNRCAKIRERLLFLCISFVQTKIIYSIYLQNLLPSRHLEVLCRDRRTVVMAIAVAARFI